MDRDLPRPRRRRLAMALRFERRCTNCRSGGRNRGGVDCATHSETPRSRRPGSRWWRGSSSPRPEVLLREASPGARNLGVDLGCGPGHTTALLSEVLQCRRTVGLDLSAEFIERARRFASDRVAFHVHDVTVVPFPVGPADLLYCRFLLTHLRDPHRLFARWATQLAPGGLLMVEEVESIATNSPALERYLEILDQMLRSQSNQLYIGSELEGAPVPQSLAKRKSGILEFPVFPADAAAMFAMNLRTWRDHPLRSGARRGAGDPAARTRSRRLADPRSHRRRDRLEAATPRLPADLSSANHAAFPNSRLAATKACMFSGLASMGASQPGQRIRPVGPTSRARSRT